MSDIQEKIKTAQDAGYTPEQIKAYLSEDKAYEKKISKAETAGYSTIDILNYLSGEAAPAVKPRVEGLSKDDPAYKTAGFVSGAANTVGFGLPAFTMNLARKGLGMDAMDVSKDPNFRAGEIAGIVPSAFMGVGGAGSLASKVIPGLAERTIPRAAVRGAIGGATYGALQTPEEAQATGDVSKLVSPGERTVNATAGAIGGGVLGAVGGFLGRVFNNVGNVEDPRVITKEITKTFWNEQTGMYEKHGAALDKIWKSNPRVKIDIANSLNEIDNLSKINPEVGRVVKGSKELQSYLSKLNALEEGQDLKVSGKVLDSLVKDIESISGKKTLSASQLGARGKRADVKNVPVDVKELRGVVKLLKSELVNAFPESIPALKKSYGEWAAVRNELMPYYYGRVSTERALSGTMPRGVEKNAQDFFKAKPGLMAEAKGYQNLSEVLRNFPGIERYIVYPMGKGVNVIKPAIRATMAEGVLPNVLPSLGASANQFTEADKELLNMVLGKKEK